MVIAAIVGGIVGAGAAAGGLLRRRRAGRRRHRRAARQRDLDAGRRRSASGRRDPVLGGRRGGGDVAAALRHHPRHRVRAAPGRCWSAALALMGDGGPLRAAAAGNLWVVYPLNPAPGHAWVPWAWVALGAFGTLVQMRWTGGERGTGREGRTRRSSRRKNEASGEVSRSRQVVGPSSRSSLSRLPVRSETHLRFASPYTSHRTT